MRAGALGLSLLAVPMNVEVLLALEKQPMSAVDLRRALGSPPPTTMRRNLKELNELGLVTRRGPSGFQGTVDYGLAEAGRELLAVLEALERWLGESPDGPLRLGTSQAKSAVKALVDGWSAKIVRALVARPLSLTELSKIMPGVSYHSLERRLEALHFTGQIQRCAARGRGNPYAVTEWLRRAVGPLVKSMQWESCHAAGKAPSPGRIDLESILLLAIPLVSLPEDVEGTCRLQADPGSAGDRACGVTVAVERGRIISCVSRLDREAEALVTTTVPTWVQALANGHTREFEGNAVGELARSLLAGLPCAIEADGASAPEGPRMKAVSFH
ncbi:MAG: winged helix-turn-helix transcriptional regulator [Solirubrobacterales bacterium]